MSDEAPADKSREQLLTEELSRAQEVLADMERAGSWQAVVSQRRQLLQMHAELEELRALDQVDPWEAMTDEELVAAELEALEQLPDHMVEHLALALMERLGPRWVEHHIRRRKSPK